MLHFLTDMQLLMLLLQLKCALCMCLGSKTRKSSNSMCSNPKSKIKMFGEDWPCG